MELDLIPFKIGIQYENWEFELEPYKTTKTIDTYRYIGNKNKILGVKAKLILLSFNLDILEEVAYYFYRVSFERLKSNIEEFPGKNKGLIYDCKSCKITWFKII